MIHSVFRLNLHSLRFRRLALARPAPPLMSHMIPSGHFPQRRQMPRFEIVVFKVDQRNRHPAHVVETATWKRIELCAVLLRQCASHIDGRVEAEVHAEPRHSHVLHRHDQRFAFDEV